MRTVRVILFSFLGWLLFFSCKADHSFQGYLQKFASGYNSLNIPEMTYDYRDYFSTIPSELELEKQKKFFAGQKKELAQFDRSRLEHEEQIQFDHILYEIVFNLERVSLEGGWIAEGRKTPAGGLHGLRNAKEWYCFFIKRFCSLDLEPEDIIKLGKGEVQRVKKEMQVIQAGLGFADSLAFYSELKKDTYFITDKEKLNQAFARTDSTIRKHLTAFIGDIDIPEIYPMEWPQAGANTPPGIYLNRATNPYGKDVFQYNFYNKHYNRRAIEWLYMHEGIPGHHLQFSQRSSYSLDSLQKLSSYPGNFEGWACYVEYEGKKLGLFSDPYSYYGKWEWDLVRSARLVIDAGIHYYGWTREEALDYWKKNIPNQDDIAEREVTRVTNWTAQALSYKVGADCIMELKEELHKKYGNAFDEKKFHRCYLSFGMRPLAVIKKNIAAAYSLNLPK